VAMQIFGKSAEELGPLMILGKDGLAQMTDEAHKMGAVMSDEDVKAAAALNDSLTGLKAGFSGIVRTLASSFMPGMNSIVGVAQDFVQKFASAIKDPKDPEKAVIAVATTMTKTIVSYIAQGLPNVFNSAVNMIESIISGIQSVMPTLLPVAIQVIGTLVDFLVQEIPEILKMGIDILLALIEGVSGNLPALLDLGLDVLNTLLDGIMGSLPKLIAMAGILWGGS